MNKLPTPEEIQGRLDAGECAEAIRQELAAILKPAADALIELAQDIAHAVGEALKPVMDLINPIFINYIAVCRDNPKWFHLSRNARKARTRKKWQKILMMEALKR